MLLLRAAGAGRRQRASNPARPCLVVFPAATGGCRRLRDWRVRPSPRASAHSPAVCPRPSPTVARTAPLLRCKRWRPARSSPPFRVAGRAPAPRTGGARADQRRWWVRPKSANRAHAPARSTDSPSASSRRRACRWRGRERARGRSLPAIAQCGRGVRARAGQRGGRESRCFHRPTASDRDYAPVPAACRRCGATAPGGRRAFAYRRQARATRRSECGGHRR